MDAMCWAVQLDAADVDGPLVSGRAPRCVHCQRAATDTRAGHAAAPPAWVDFAPSAEPPLRVTARCLHAAPATSGQVVFDLTTAEVNQHGPQVAQLLHQWRSRGQLLGLWVSQTGGAGTHVPALAASGTLRHWRAAQHLHAVAEPGRPVPTWFLVPTALAAGVALGVASAPRGRPPPTSESASGRPASKRGWGGGGERS